ADHRADNDGRGCPRAKVTHKFEALFYNRRGRAHAERSAARAGRILLIRLPTENVTAVPMKKYHGYAIEVNRQKEKIAASPQNMPMVAPTPVARLSNVPNRKRPSRLPNGNETTVSPASSSGPHETRLNPINTAPQTSVMRRDKRRNCSGLVCRPLSREKSRTVLAASEFSEPLTFDIATARIEA